MPKKRNKIYGVGINDADYPVSKSSTVILENGKRVRKLSWYCPIFAVWKGMLQRCYSEKCQKIHPTYIGTVVCDEWLVFSVFKSWMDQQDWEGKELDKDILGDGQIYGPTTCCFVSVKINNFLTHRKSKTTDLPTGVHMKGNLFVAQTNNEDGKRTHIGYFESPEKAYKAWLERRLEIAKILADREALEDYIKVRFLERVADEALKAPEAKETPKVEGKAL